MGKPNFTELIPTIADKIAPMVDGIIQKHSHNVHSIHIVGSAVMPDYNDKLSDINSVVILHNMDLKFITFLAPLGKKYAKKRIAAPLIMTPQYIVKSVDAFPIEFFDFKLIHKTVYGEDILNVMKINKYALHLQCQRDIKIKLMGLRQGYLSSLGEKEHLASGLVRTITGSMALFRAIIFLLGKEPPIPRTDVINTLGAVTGIESDIFKRLLMLKARTIKPTEQELLSLFEQYYNVLESVEKITDDLHV